MENLEQRVLTLLSSQPFQRLKAFYNQTTLFNVIGAERNENRHSAFLGWLLNPESSHGLGAEPLKLFLRLVATLKWGPQTFGEVLYRKVLAGNFEIELLEPIELEKNVGEWEPTFEQRSSVVGPGHDKWIKQPRKDRIDVWTVVCLTYEEEGVERKHAFPIVIENKIYSNLAEKQTQRYYDAMLQYIDTMKESAMAYSPIGVLLSPDGKNPDCGQFTSMTYQQMLDYVLTPVSVMTMPATEYSFIETYIRNLGRPSDAANHDYSPLAVSKEECDLIKSVQSVDKTNLLDELLVATYGSKAEQMIGRTLPIGDAEQQRLLLEVWDANENVFKAIAYQQYTEKKDILTKLFKGNNRDNTKYRVYYGDGKTEVFPRRRLSKAMAACAIFKAYISSRPGTTLEQLREAFPCKDVNNYYLDNYYADLFYLFPEEVNEAGEPCLAYTSNRRNGIPSLAKWDFYLGDEQLLQLADGKKVMCVKMWRKDDFDNLLWHVEKELRPRVGKFVIIEECL
jgi:hypothetical protein